MAPGQPGRYLLLLDVVSPLYGSLTARGMPPVTITATIAPAPGTLGTAAVPR